MKIEKGNYAPFIDVDIRKAICTRGRLRNKFYKNPSEKNETKCKNQRNLCVFLRREAIK